MAKTSYEGMIEVNSILNFYALGSVFTSERFYNTDFLAILVGRRLAFVPSIGDFFINIMVKYVFWYVLANF